MLNKLKKSFIISLFMLVLWLVLSGCQSEIDLINLVKNKRISDYNTMTIEKTLSSIFDSPEWRFFETNKGEKIVEFSGKVSKNLHQDIVNNLKQEFKHFDYKNDKYAFYPLSIYLIGKIGIEIGTEESNSFFERIVTATGCEDYFCDGNPVFIEMLINEYLKHAAGTIGVTVVIQWFVSVDGKTFKLAGIFNNELKKLEYEKLLEKVFNTIYK